MLNNWGNYFVMVKTRLKINYTHDISRKSNKSIAIWVI